MKKVVMLMLSAIIFFGCSYTYMTGRYNGKVYRLPQSVNTQEEATALAKQMYEEEQKAEEEKRKAEEEAAKQAKEAKKAEFQKSLSALLKEKCSPERWTGYMVAHSFANNSKKLKLNPFKIMWGNAYETRHLQIDVIELQNAAQNLGIGLIKNYTNKEVAYGYYNILESLSAEQEKAFNNIVARYNQCYEQLK